MKRRNLVLVLGIVVTTIVATLSVSSDRIPWIIICFLCFGGIPLFDVYSQVPRRWMNILVLLATYGLVLNVVSAQTVESFWRNFAGAVFLIALLFEQNAQPWSGFGPLRTTVTPALIFLMLVLAQSIPYLPPETLYGLSFSAIILASYLELFSVFRENSAMNAGSFMTALRVATVGGCGLFYAAVFLPGIARQAPFNNAYIGIPAIAVAMAIFSTFLKQWRRRQTIFCSNWTLFIFWAALTGEGNRFYAAVAALVGGVWAVMMTDRNAANAQNPRELYLKLSAWGLPGSLLFTLIVFCLVPTSNELVQRGSGLWLISFFIFWSGLRSFSFPTEKVSSKASADWRSRLALVVSLFGAALLAGIKILPEIFSNLWPGLIQNGVIK